MEYSIKQCPKCNGELHIPIDLKTCICMFCGEAFDLKDVEKSSVSEVDLQVIEVDYRKVLEGISGLINNYAQLLPKFTKDYYCTNFEQYVQTSTQILQPAEHYAALTDGNVDKVADEISHAIVEAIENDLTGTKGGLISSSKNKIIDQYRFFLTVYTVPMILHLNYSFSEPLADCIIDKWRQRFPEFAFNKGSYENLQAGFERKGYCFITTAVCETLNKADNCDELTAFRKFRDTYMQQTKERQLSMETYYQIAPAIVASIDMRPNYKETYRYIWSEYLQPCLKDMEENRLDHCEKHYIKMVQELKNEFYIISDYNKI